MQAVLNSELGYTLKQEHMSARCSVGPDLVNNNAEDEGIDSAPLQAEKPKIQHFNTEGLILGKQQDQPNLRGPGREDTCLVTSSKSVGKSGQGLSV